MRSQWTHKWARKLAFVLTISALTCTDVFAWSGEGHRAIGEQVLEQLNPAMQKYYVTLAQDFSAKRQSKYKARDAFISLSSWPDEIRNIPIAELFKQFDTPLPKELKPFAKASSGRWHYYNAVSKSDNARCKFVNQGQLLKVMPFIDKALKHTSSRTQEALLLAFQLHFMQDLHQPLHTLTRLDQQCDSDLGGNAVCLEPYEGGRCPMNLHRLWDQGFGIFGELEKIAMHGVASKAELLLFDPKAWVQESFKFYDTVYHYNHDSYDEKGRNITRERVGQAISRQVHYLVRHYNMKHHKSE